MGIESDQVVFEYLSRVGDVAQQRQLPSATRMRLVSDLRNEIDRHRARTTVDSPAAVRRILDRLGTPDDIVEAAGSGDAAHRAPAPPSTAVPEQRDPAPGRSRRVGAPEPPGGAGGGSGGGTGRKGPRGPAPGSPRASGESGEAQGRPGLKRSTPGSSGESGGAGAGGRRGLWRSAPEAPKDSGDSGDSGGAGGAGGAGGRKGLWRFAPRETGEPGGGERRKGLWRSAPGSGPLGEHGGAARRKGPWRPDPEPPAGPGGASPHRVGAAGLGDSAVRLQPDWWRMDDGPFAGTTLADGVPGFVGGVEIPDLLKPPPRPKEEAEEEAEEVEEVIEAPTAGRARGRRRRLPRLWPEGGWNNPLLLVAAVLLVVGAVAGQLVPLGLGWLIAYLSRRLTPAQRKWAVLGLPGTVAAGAVVWLWGRTEGRWGAPIAEGQMNTAVTDTWPWTLRAAAVATALYLLWHTRRPRG